MSPEMPPGVRLGKSQTSDHRYIIRLEHETDPEKPVPELDLRAQSSPYHLSGKVEQDGSFGFSVTKHELPRYAALLGHLLRIHPKFKSGDELEADADICDRLSTEEIPSYIAQFIHVYLQMPVTLIAGGKRVELPLPHSF